MVQDVLERTKRLVWPEIEKYLNDPAYPVQFKVPAKYQKDIDLYWKINRVYPERKGKYLRPALVLLTAEALGTKTNRAVKTAAAMQISQDWILIHDDIEDGSDERRGAPTLHKLYGPALALNAGDALQTVMWRVISDVNNSKISNEFYTMLMRTVLGQGIELSWSSKKTISEDEYFLIADSKSAYYSVAGPMRLGAIIAGANKDQIEKITEFGLYLGRCFQLIDDILDFDQDKKEGKVTLANTKGVAYTKKLAVEAKKKAKEVFDGKLKFLKHEPARGELKELIDFILERKY